MKKQRVSVECKEWLAFYLMQKTSFSNNQKPHPIIYHSYIVLWIVDYFVRIQNQKRGYHVKH